MRLPIVCAALALALSGCAGENSDAGPSPLPSTAVPVTPPAAPVTSGPVTALPTQVAGPQVKPGGTVTDGASIAGELLRDGQRDEFTLDLGSAREFYLTDMNGPDMTADVIASVDGSTAATAELAWGQYVVTLTKSGTHKLVVRGKPNTVGPYSLQLHVVKVRTIPAQIGQTLTGTLDVRGRIDRYDFDTAGAQAVQVNGVGSGCDGIQFEIRPASDRREAHASIPLACGFRIPLQTQGKMTLIVRQPLAQIAPYSVQLVRVS